MLLGLYVYKANSRELSNRIFALFCAFWSLWIIALNFVSMSTSLDTASLWNHVSVYSVLVLMPVLFHFVLVFPYRSGLLKHRWLLPAAYGLAAVGLVLTLVRKEFLIRQPTIDSVRRVYGPEASPVLYFALSASFTIAVVLLILRYTLTDLDVTRKRLAFVTFAFASYALYEAIGDVHANRDAQFLASFTGDDLTFWRLNLATNALLLLTYFSLLALLALRTRVAERRKESLFLILSGAAAVVTGYLDPVLSFYWQDYPGTLWAWRIAGVTLVFYAILKYQLFDLNIRIRFGVKYGARGTAFAAVFFTVQELVRDLGGEALGYFAGLLLAAALVFLFEPFQRLTDKLAHKVVPPTTTETYERYRAMEIYRAALEGALADQVVTPAELHSLKNLRAKLAITDSDHDLLERDIRGALQRGGV